MTPYEQIAGAIIQKQMVVLGADIALTRARKVPGLEVGDGGVVSKITGDTGAALEALVGEYQELLGPAALSFARDAARPVIKNNPALTLPRALQE
jgi:hypothetical protein